MIRSHTGRKSVDVAQWPESLTGSPYSEPLAACSDRLPDHLGGGVGPAAYREPASGLVDPAVMLGHLRVEVRRGRRSAAGGSDCSMGEFGRDQSGLDEHNLNAEPWTSNRIASEMASTALFRRVVDAPPGR